MSNDQEHRCRCGKSTKSLTDTAIGKVVILVASTAGLTLIFFGIVSLLSLMVTGNFSAITDVNRWGGAFFISALYVLIWMYITGHFDSWLH